MDSKSDRSSGEEVKTTQSPPRALEVSRELENFKELMSKVRYSLLRFKSPLRCLNDTQKERAVKVLEKRAETQMNQLRQVINESRKGPDIYEIIAKQFSKYSFSINIPETLLFHYTEPNPIFLYTADTGVVHCDKSKNSATKFFETVLNTEYNLKYTTPLFIHIAMNEKAQVCESREEAQSLFNSCPLSVHRLQRFISPHSNHISKLRVHWKISKLPRIYTITKKKPIKQPSIPSISKAPTHFKTKSMHVSHKYIHKLLPTSMSVNLPFSKPKSSHELKLKTPNYSIHTTLSSPQGCLTQDITRPVSPPHTPDPKSTNHHLKTHKSIQIPFMNIISDSNDKLGKERIKELNNKFIVHYSNMNDCNVISSSQQIPEVTRILRQVSDIISHKFLKKPNSIEDLVVDIMKDTKGKWIFLASKGYKLRGDKNLPRSSSFHKIIKRQKSIYFMDIAEQYRQEDLALQYNISVSKEYNYKDQGIRYTSTNQEAKKVQLVRHLEEKAKNMEAHPVYIDKKQMLQRNVETYLKCKNVDKQGRIPFKMIGMTHYPNETKLITFYETSKEPPLKPTRHKDRIKNLSWTDGSFNSYSMVNMTCNHIDKIARQYDSRLKSAIDCKDENNKNMILLNLLAEQKDRWNRVPSILADKLYCNHSLAALFENKNRDEIENIFRLGLFTCLHPGKSVGIRTRIRKSHYPMKISQENFEEFVKVFKESLHFVFTDEDAIELAITRIRRFEADIVAEDENPRLVASRNLN